MKTIKKIKRGQLEVFPTLVCEDGYTLHIVAGVGCASTPANNLPTLGDYSTVEIMWAFYQENWDGKTNLVNPTEKNFVPLDKIEKIVEEHGGLR